MARVEIIIEVPSVEETVEWYQRVLGWRGGFDVFDRDNNCLFGGVYTFTPSSEKPEAKIGFDLARSEKTFRNSPNWQALIYVDDVEQVLRRVLDSGWQVETGIEAQPWGARTFNMLDLNGIRLRFAQMTEHLNMEEIQKRIDDSR